MGGVKVHDGFVQWIYKPAERSIITQVDKPHSVSVCFNLHAVLISPQVLSSLSILISFLPGHIYTYISTDLVHENICHINYNHCGQNCFKKAGR